MTYRHKQPTTTARLMLLTATIFLVGTLTTAAGGKQEQNQDSGNGSDTSGNSTRIEIQEPAEAESEQPQQEEATETKESDDDNMVAIDRPAWAVAIHDNIDRMQEEVSETIDTGYIPAGMEANADGTITVLYTIATELVPERWLLEAYEPDEVNKELTERLLEGWNPLGFSVLNGKIMVLYGTGGAEIAAWRIHQTEMDQEALQKTIEDYRKDNYAIVDISIDPQDEQLWYLFVQQEGRATGGNASLFFNAYPKGEQTIAGISTDYTDGRGMPYGIATGDAISLVMFVR